MRTAEKNDVDITQLFRYKTEVEVKDELSGEVGKFYLRIIGDADLNRARVFGLRRAARLRKALQEPGSELREAYITDQSDVLSREVLLEGILLLNVGELQKQIVNMTDVPEPRAPKSDASQEEQEAFQLEIDEYENKYRTAYDKNAKKVEKIERKKLEAMSDDELYQFYEGSIINKLALEEMTKRYYEMCVFLGTYKDLEYKTRAFDNYEDFDNASVYLKERLQEQYRYLELGMLELKKSPEVTD